MSRTKRFLHFVLLAFALTACFEGEERVVKSYSDYDVHGTVIKDGIFTDARNGHEYRIMKIGTARDVTLWFAENLDYVDSTLEDGSWCFENSKDSCEVYGRLYNWETAQKACPDGWHLPSHSEWEDLWAEAQYGSAGSKLKTIDHWQNADSVHRGTNQIGFYGLPAGRKNIEGGWLPTGKFAYFWSSTYIDAEIAYGWQLSYDTDEFRYGEYYRGHGMSVRCIREYDSYWDSDISIEGSFDTTYLDEIPVTYGTLDYKGRTYKTVEIGDTYYMAENMNYETGNSWCYNNSADSCKKYGRLYDKETAVKVCPEGWRLPETVEADSVNEVWRTLYSLQNNGVMEGYTAEEIKSVEGWSVNPGNNASGFNLLPSGGYDIGAEAFFDRGVTAYFWARNLASTDSVSLVSVALGFASEAFSQKENGPNMAYPVRCVKE